LGLGILITVAFLSSFVDLGKAILVIASTNLAVYSLAFISVTLGTLTYTLAWHFFLKDAGIRIELLREWAIVWASIFLNLLVPTGSVGGEVVRAYLAQRESRAKGSDRSLGEVLATILAQRIITMAPFLLGSIMGFVYLAIAYGASGLILGLASFLVILFTGAFLAVCYLCLSPGKVEKVVHGFIHLLYRIPVQSLRKKIDKSYKAIDENVKALTDGLMVIRRRPKTLILASIFSALFWAFDAFVAYFAFQAIGFPIPIGTLLFVYTIGVTLQMIPIGIPGMVGAVEVTMIALYSATGIPLEVGAVATILIRIVMLWFEILVGGLATYAILVRRR
jgi:uncharacterized protein (TIRG00374 family)